MLELILLTVLLASLAGLLIIVVKKIPALSNLPATSNPRDPLILRMRSQIKNLPGADTFDYEVYLQKVLSKVRVLTLKTEHKTGSWLEKLRQKSNQKKNEKDNYWEELKKAKDGE